MFQDNPEEFIVKVSDLIVGEKATMIVNYISYNRLNERYDSAIFTENMTENLSRAYHAKKNIQVFPSSLVTKTPKIIATFLCLTDKFFWCGTL